jgi:hypothetical protein
MTSRDIRNLYQDRYAGELSMVAQTTTRSPLEWTANPPISTPWRPAMSLTRGVSVEFIYFISHDANEFQ